MLQTFENDDLQKLNPDQTSLSSAVDLEQEASPQQLNIKNSGSSVTTDEPEPVTDPIKKNPVNRGQAFNPAQPTSTPTPEQQAQGPDFFKDLYNKLDFTNTEIKNESDFTYKLLHDEEFRDEINGLLKVTPDNETFTDAIYGQFNDYSGPYVDPDVKLAGNEDWLKNLPQAFEKFRPKLSSPDAIIGGVPEWLQPKLQEGIDQIVQDPENPDNFYIVGKDANGNIGVAKGKNTENNEGISGWLSNVKDSLTNILVGTGASVVTTAAELMNLGYNETHRYLYGSYDTNTPTPGLVDKLKQQYLNTNLPTSINYDKQLSPEEYAKLGLDEKFFKGLDEVFDSKYWIGGIGDQGATSGLEIAVESYILSRLGVKIPGLGIAGGAIDDVIGAGAQTFKRAGNWAATVGLYAAANTGLESAMEGRAKFQELYDRYKQSYPDADENTIVEAARAGMLETMGLNIEAISASNVLESALLHIPVGKIGNSFLGMVAKTPFSGVLEGLQELLQYGIGKYIDEKYKTLIPETTSSHAKTLEEIGGLIDSGINNDKEAMDSFIAGAVLGAGMPILFDTKDAIENTAYKHYNKNLIAIAHEQLYNGNSAMFKEGVDSKGKPLTIFNKDAVASFDNFASSVLKNNNTIQEVVDQSENFLDSKDDVQVLLTERMAMFLDNAIRREPELLKLSSDKLQEKLAKVILKETDFDKSDYRQLGFDKKLTFEDWNEMRHTALNTALNVFEQFGDIQNKTDHVGNLTNDTEFRDHINTKINQNIFKLRAVNAAVATIRNNTFTTRNLDPNLTEDQINEQLGENEEYDKANNKIISKSDPKKYEKYTKLLNLNSKTILNDGLISLDKNKISKLVKNLENDYRKEKEEAVKHEEERQENVLAKVLANAKKAGSNLSKKAKNYSLIERMFGKKKTIKEDNPSNLTSNENDNKTNSGSNTAQTSDKTDTESITDTSNDTSGTTQQQDDLQDRPTETSTGNTETDNTSTFDEDQTKTVENDDYKENTRIPQIGDKLKSLAGGTIDIIGFNNLQQPIVLDNGEEYEITKSQFSEALEKGILSYEEINDEIIQQNDAALEQKYKELIENHSAKFDKNAGISPVDYFDNVIKDINANVKDQKIKDRLITLVESETNKLLKTIKVDDVLDMLNSIIENKNNRYQMITITPDGYVKYNTKTIPEEVEGYASSIAYTAREDKKLLDVKTNKLSFQHNTKYNFPHLKLLSSKHIPEGEQFRVIGIDTNPVIYIPFADDYNIIDETTVERVEKPLNEWFKDNAVRNLRITKDLSIEVTKEDFYDIQIQALSADVKASIHIPTFFNKSNTSDELIADRIQKNLIFRRLILDKNSKITDNQIVTIPLEKRNYGPLNTIHTNNMSNQPITSKSIENYDKLPVALYLNGELTYVEGSDLEGLAHLDNTSIDFSEIFNGRPVMLLDNGIGKIEPLPLRTPTIPENVQNVLLEIAESVISNKPMREDLYQAFIKLDPKFRDLYNKDKNGKVRYFNFPLFNELFELYVNPQTKNEKSTDPLITGSLMRLDYDKYNKPIIKVKGFNKSVAKHFNQAAEGKKYNQKELKDEIALLRLSLNKSLLESDKELPTLHISNETTVLVTYPYSKYIRHNLKTYIEPIKIDGNTYTARINPILELGIPQIQNLEDTATLATSGVKPVSEQTVGQNDASEPTVAFNSLQTFGNVISNDLSGVENQKADIEKLEKEKQKTLQPLIEEKEQIEKEIEEIEKDSKSSKTNSQEIESLKEKIKDLRNTDGTIPENKLNEFRSLRKQIQFLESDILHNINKAINEFISDNNLTEKDKKLIYALAEIRDNFQEVIDEFNEKRNSNYTLSEIMTFFGSSFNLQESIETETETDNKKAHEYENKLLEGNGFKANEDYTADELNDFVQKHGSKQVKFIWNLIKAVAQKLGVTTRFMLQGNSKIPVGAAGHYLNGKIENRASLFSHPESAARIIVHELVHGVTTYILKAVEQNNTKILSKLTTRQLKAVEKLNALFDELKKDKEFDDTYGTKNTHELLAELTNENFVDKLKSKNVFEKILEAIFEIFNIPFNAYNESVKILEDLISNPLEDNRYEGSLGEGYSLYSKSESTKLQQLKQRLVEVNKKINEVTKRFNAQIAQKQAELKALEQQPTSNQSEIEAKKADIERRKQALRDLMKATGDDIFMLGVEDGTFMGESLLNMNENGDVVLTRYADSEEGLTKGKGKTKNLKDIAGQFGGEQIATSGIEGGAASFTNGVVGEYHIPLQELIDLIKSEDVVFAGLGNKEFVLSPHIADKYLTKINGKQINAKYDAELAELNNSTKQTVTNELSDIIDNLPLDNIPAEVTAKVKTQTAVNLLLDINPDEINPSMMEKTGEEILQNTKNLINFASPETIGESQNKDC